MANVSEGDSSSLHIVLERIEPARNIARYYVLSIEPTLFATHTLIRRWGRIGCLGRERLQFFGGEDATRAQVTLETWLARKRKRGYAPRSEPARPTLLLHDSHPDKFIGPTIWDPQRGLVRKKTALRRREEVPSDRLPLRDQIITEASPPRRFCR
jgi:predicted DNA-binding WGR domain protein